MTWKKMREKHKYAWYVVYIHYWPVWIWMPTAKTRMVKSRKDAKEEECVDDNGVAICGEAPKLNILGVSR